MVETKQIVGIIIFGIIGYAVLGIIGAIVAMAIIYLLIRRMESNSEEEKED